MLPDVPQKETAPLPVDDPLWRHALQVFDDATRAARWFHTGHIQLGMSPLEAIEKPEGRRTIDSILTSIEHGLPA